MDCGTWIQRLEGVRQEESGKLHKPLLLLLALARVRRGQSRLATFEEFESELVPLLKTYGDLTGRPDASLPYWYLRHDRVWEVRGPDGDLWTDIAPAGVARVSGKTLPLRGYLGTTRGGFPEDLQTLLSTDRSCFRRAVATVAARLEPRERRAAVLLELSLGSDAVFGHLPGIPPGAVFPSRRALFDAGLHRTPQAGIYHASKEPAESIVVSGGYEDDQDTGDEIIYTGHGGRNEAGRQVADQRWTHGNLALARSCDGGFPVRVIRGARGKPEHAPESGYRYDGLFRVDSYWTQTGKSGFQVCRYRLVQMESVLLSDPSLATPARMPVTIQRIVRNTAVTDYLKELHEYRCQVCGTVIETLAGPYAEGAHIRPLGTPHHGLDTPGNVLCLCPNDHVRLDRGAIRIEPDLTVVDTRTGTVIGHLHIDPRHHIDLTHLEYHRSLWPDSHGV